MRHGGNVWDEGQPGRWQDHSANLRPEGTPDWVLRVMQDALKDTRYYPDRAMKQARRGLAEFLGLPEEMVLPTAGGAQAIDLVIAQGSGRVIVSPPTFSEYAERARVHGRAVCEDGEAFPGDTVICCNPNNPTGALIPKEKLLALAEHVRQRGAELMVDEAFIFCCPDSSVRQSAGPGLTVVGSLTKALCIPGVRLGYVCAAPELIRSMEKQMLPWSLNTLAAAAAQALPGHQAELEADARLNAARCTRMAAELERIGVHVMPSAANFLLCDMGQDTAALVRELKRHGILVRECASFGLTGQWLRLAVRTDEENERLIQLIRQWKETGACAERV